MARTILETRGKKFIAVLRWANYPRLKVTLGEDRTFARNVEQMLYEFKDRHWLKPFDMLKKKQIDIGTLYDMKVTGRLNELEQAAKASDVELRPLVAAWIKGAQAHTILTRWKKHYSYKTLWLYEGSWAGIFEALGKEKPVLGDLTQDFLDGFRTRKHRPRGVTQDAPNRIVDSNTINNAWTAIQAVFRWAEVKKGLLMPTLTFERVSQTRKGKAPKRYLNVKEIRLVRQACYATDWPFIGLKLTTGMRYDEIAFLDVGDLDWELGRINVQEGEREVKSDSSVRAVPMSEQITELLVQQLTMLVEYLGREPKLSDPLFPEQRDTMEDRRARKKKKYERTRDRWKATLKRAGVPDARLHDLRHTFAVQARQAGLDMTEIQQIMGHSSPDVTAWYATIKPSDEEQNSMMNEVSNQMFGGDQDDSNAPKRAPKGLALVG